MLPQDSHVHTEWSWDTVTGSMVRSCERALELGLPSPAFTEHADLTPWLIPEPVRPHLPEHFRVRLRADGVLALLNVFLRLSPGPHSALLFGAGGTGRSCWRPPLANLFGSCHRTLRLVHTRPSVTTVLHRFSRCRFLGPHLGKMESGTPP
ncbi:hypothetical protein [Amycolatopsis sp. FDAARGOS 1241]|uniref:hypothetical protein n=1 Tax=Amycolatopsis sp. FDAARGOS 1241 TaxID=2778070 RepID=UPI001EF24FBE|nr:hypothetical protein [Amycolatopsis sp. FDAARGOS 1241]